MTNLKTCSRCKAEKASLRFHKDKTRKDGLCSQCKVCMAEYRAKWQKENPEKVAAYGAKWAKGNPEKVRAKSKRRRKTPRGWFGKHKNAAKQRGIETTLTLADIETHFWNKPCHYCDLEIEGSGIDRQHNSEGYTLDNCVSCCFACNSEKKDKTLKQFYETPHYQRILANKKLQADRPKKQLMLIKALYELHLKNNLKEINNHDS